MRVLIVDDEKLARNRLRELLSDIGGHDIIGEAMNGNEAVEKTSELNPDVLLMDIRMPGMDGLEAAMHLLGMDTPPSVICCNPRLWRKPVTMNCVSRGVARLPILRKNCCIRTSPSWVGSIEQNTTGSCCSSGGKARSATTMSSSCKVGRPVRVPSTRPERS